MNSLVQSLLVCLLALTTLASAATFTPTSSIYRPSNFAKDTRTASDATTTNFGSELSGLPFQQIFSLPLMAVIDAQAAAAAKTHEYVNNVGFTTDSNGLKRVIYVEFNYKSYTSNGTSLSRKMQVPFLYMVPIPFLTVDSVSIELNVKLESLSERTDVTQVTSSESVTQRRGWGGFWGNRCWVCHTVAYGSVSSQENTKSSVQIKTEFNLNIQVLASQAPLPGGASRMLELFDQLVNSDLAINGTQPSP